MPKRDPSWRTSNPAWVLLLILPVVAPLHGAFAGCRLDAFTGRAQKNGWIAHELTDDERANFLDHLNHDDGVNTNFHPPHLWQTVRKENRSIHIRVVFLDAANCVLGNSGDIGAEEFSYLLAPRADF